MSDDNVRQMLMLAERLRESHGAELDDSAIQAVSEATGAPSEYVRLALRMLPEKRKQSLAHRIHNMFLALEPDTRRHMVSGVVATLCAYMNVLEAYFKDKTGFFGAILLVGVGVGLWNVALSRDTRTAASTGALFGGIFFVAQSLFALLFHLSAMSMTSALLLPFVLGGGVLGLLTHTLVSRNRAKLGLKDPVQERQDLLRQLVDLQDKLRSGEQSMTFLSLDVVGSTQMKALTDPLNVEFTFTEYHNFVDTIVKRYGGRVHSTAGDGVTCAFPHPQQAYGAARNIQAGLIEFNQFRNRIGVPVTLRAGIHTGAVIAPTPGDIQSLNFAHVIDVAAHLQKCAPPGGVAVSHDAAAMIPGGMGAIGQRSVEAQGVQAVVWEPRVAIVPGGQAEPPPTPAHG